MFELFVQKTVSSLAAHLRSDTIFYFNNLSVVRASSRKGFFHRAKCNSFAVMCINNCSAHVSTPTTILTPTPTMTFTKHTHESLHTQRYRHTPPLPLLALYDPLRWGVPSRHTRPLGEFSSAPSSYTGPPPPSGSMGPQASKTFNQHSRFYLFLAMAFYGPRSARKKRASVSSTPK